MQLVSYSPCSLTFALPSSSCITLAAQEELAVARLASPLAYFFISPEKFPVPPFLSVYRTLYHALSDTSSYMHSHTYVLPVSSYILSSVECFMSIGPSFRNRATDRDDPSFPGEGEVRPWCARRPCSLCNGDVG
jgi:hypothetical protein